MAEPTTRTRNSNLNERTHLLHRNHIHLNSQQDDSKRVRFQETSFRESEAELEDSSSLGAIAYQPEKHYLKRSCQRLPRGKGVLLVIFIYFMESFAFNSTLNGLQHILFGNQPGSVWVFTFLEGTAGRIVYPVAGLLADTYLGRFQVIHIGLWLLWIGFALLAFSQAIVSPTSSVVFRYILPIISAVLISLGAGSVEVNTISFGVDQLEQGCTSEELSSYFYWYYFNRNTGYLLATITSLLIFGIPSSVLGSPGKGVDLSDTLYSGETLIAVAAISTALITHHCLQNWYFKDRKRENPIKSLINVLYYSATARRQLPVYRRAFRRGEGKKPRIELAKIEYDGIFSSEEVENVKTFCRIIFLIFTLGGYFATYGAAFSMLGYQFNKTTIELMGSDGAYLASNFLSLINAVTFLVFLPILNHILIPFLSGFSMRVRIGSGLICNLLCVAIAALLQGKYFNLSSSAELGWLVVPAILVSLGDALTVVTSVEFIYAQSPETMKGLLTGLLYLAYGVFRGGGIVFFHSYSGLIMADEYSILYFYVMFTIVATLGLVQYVIVACLYRYRHRPTGDDSEDELVRRAMAANVFGH